ncbi:hypothetical protein N7516_007430 [Penicillium verrucosum]|uniref:uncharacterized protein n=1 Tax=Penicillium verrucosum TaxID=60171 RepID=UPI0025450549|nr:uncharacterized protein N7516_007430 [Penicillium verrucosum]KAJ5932941.1 hypothetical protein N7516_007430 [Penicillium verrucosum]
MSSLACSELYLYIGTEVTFNTPSSQTWVLEEKLTEGIPIEGNEYQRPEVRQRKAAPPRKHGELDVLKDLKLRKCPVVPSLLAYKEGKQGNDGLVVDGYITHIVWDKVPGKELNQDMVWNRTSGPLREAVRAKFRDVWGELRRYGWQPAVPGLENIIYDEVTETMHIIGFRDPALFEPEEKDQREFF